MPGRNRALALSGLLCLGLSFAGVSGVQAEESDRDTSEQRHHAVATAPIKPWTKLSGNLNLTRQPDTLRVGNRLHVVWSQTDPGNTASVRTRILNSGGKVVSGVRRVVSGWVSLINSPELVTYQGDVLSVFAGIRSFAPSDPYVGPAVYASSANGLNWDLEPGSLSNTTAAENVTTGIAVVRAQGEPLFAMGDFGAAILHRGIDDDSPASTPDFEAADSNATHVSLATDTKTGKTWLGWYGAGGTDPADVGMLAQKVWPRPNGALLHAPRTTGGAINPGQSVAMASRVGGGVWMAYPQGTPTSKVIRLWKVGTKNSWTVRSKSTVDTLALSTAPRGRLWLSWRTAGDGKLHAALTNRSVTRIGRVHTIPTPGRASGTYWSTSIEGSAGPLNVVASVQANGGEPRIYSVQIQPR